MRFRRLHANVTEQDMDRLARMSVFNISTRPWDWAVKHKKSVARWIKFRGYERKLREWVKKHNELYARNVKEDFVYIFYDPGSKKINRQEYMAGWIHVSVFGSTADARAALRSIVINQIHES